MIVIKEANMGTGEGEVIKCTEECKMKGKEKWKRKKDGRERKMERIERRKGKKDGKKRKMEEK